MKHWAIIFYMEARAITFIEVVRHRKPTRFVHSLTNHFTRFEIVLLGEPDLEGVYL